MRDLLADVKQSRAASPLPASTGGTSPRIATSGSSCRPPHHRHRRASAAPCRSTLKARSGCSRCRGTREARAPLP